MWYVWWIPFLCFCIFCLKPLAELCVTSLVCASTCIHSSIGLKEICACFYIITLELRVELLMAAVLKWLYTSHFVLPPLCVSLYKSDTVFLHVQRWQNWLLCKSTTSLVAVTPYNGNNLQHGCWFWRVNGTSVLGSARKCSTKSLFCHR